MKPNFIGIPLFVAGVAALGSVFTGMGMPEWYSTITQPSFAPPSWIFGPVWTVIFICAALSLGILWNTLPRGKTFSWILGIFFVNGLANIAWSALFFALHVIGWAVVDAIVIATTAYALIALSWPHSRGAALLLVPYAAWVTFAAYLNYVIWTLN